MQFLKTTIISSLLILAALPAFSCDVCNIFEYSMMKNKSYFGIFHRHRVFNGYEHLGNNHDFLGRPQRKSTLHEPENAGFYVNKSDKDYETYTTLELRGNYTYKEKFNFLFILPYERNVVYYDQVIDAPNPMKDSTISLSGWGDFLIAMDYIIQKETDKGRHTIRPGIAFRLPTGQYKKQDNYGNVHDPIIQPGTSALSVIFRMNYQYFLNRHGINASVNYKLSELGKNQYQFANSFNFMGNYFHQIPVGKNYIIPRVGGYLETAGYDFYYESRQNLTGGTTLFGNFGLDFNRKNVTIQVMYQAPISDNLNGNQLGNAGRINTGIVINVI